MLIDMHAHSSGISHCCLMDAAEVVKVAKEHGMDGIVLTNHYQSRYAPDGDFEALAKRYMAEYRYAKQCGEQVGCRVFFGIEVTMEKHGGVHLLVYGVDDTFVESNPTLFAFSQEQLYRAVKENAGVLIQAHPMRNGKNVLLDLAYLDGVEINSHPLYDSTHFDELSEIAASAGLILTSGGDFHADTHRPHCGMILPEDIGDTVQLAAYLREVQTVELCIQEPSDRHSRTVIFRRGEGTVG